MTFQWNGGVGVTQYWLFVGTSPGSSDIESRDMGTQLSTVVAGLPMNGLTIYVQLNSYTGGAWQFNDYTFTAASAPAPQKAELVTPAPGTTLTSSTVSFDWTGGVNATQYWLFIGSTAGASDILSRDLGLNLSTVVAGLPADSRTLYVRLHTYAGGAWQFNDYTFTAATLALQKAQLVSPAAGSTLNSSTVTFQWTGGVGPTQYRLDVGTTPGAFDIANLNLGNELAAVVSGLPVGGQTIYVRLHSFINGAWQFNDYTLTAVGGEEEQEEEAMARNSAVGDTLVLAASDEPPFDLWPVAVARREGPPLPSGLR